MYKKYLQTFSHHTFERPNTANNFEFFRKKVTFLFYLVSCKDSGILLLSVIFVPYNFKN